MHLLEVVRSASPSWLSVLSSNTCTALAALECTIHTAAIAVYPLLNPTDLVALFPGVRFVPSRKRLDIHWNQSTPLLTSPDPVLYCVTDTGIICIDPDMVINVRLGLVYLPAGHPHKLGYLEQDDDDAPDEEDATTHAHIHTLSDGPFFPYRYTTPRACRSTPPILSASYTS